MIFPYVFRACIRVYISTYYTYVKYIMAAPQRSNEFPG